MNRRELIAAGVLGSAGLSLSGPIPGSAAAGRPPRDLSCILLWLDGGPSSIDMWDLKPAAPSEVRGPFRPIGTNVSGIQICEHLPLCATLADKYCLVRSVTHPRLDHEGAAHVMTTGWNTWPAQTRPTYPAAAFSDKSSEVGRYGSMEVVPPTLPHRNTSALGLQLTTARRVVETGTRFVTVVDPGWDTHTDHFARYENELLPRLDRALYRLVRELDDRGMLETTLVMVAGEFSRTPTINREAGRDHWSHVQTLFLAGGGLPGGSLLGASDPLGAYPSEHPITPAEVAATLYHKLGLDLHARVTTPSGLSVPLLPEGAHPIPELL